MRDQVDLKGDGKIEMSEKETYFLASGSGNKYRLIREMSSGAEGTVYEVRNVLSGEHCALKLYYKKNATSERKKRLEKLVRRGNPCKDKFAWPEELIEYGDTYGYVMQLIPNGWCDLVDLYDNRVQPDFSTITKIAINVCLAFRMLHREGLCYGDINMRNLRFSPKTGQIMICDCDNTVYSGEKSSVGGTLKFQAPELVLEQAGVSTNTDRHSLAVLLFYLFCVHHPLDGVREWRTMILDEKAMKDLYGEHPLFIFDPEDNGNRPVKAQSNAISYWLLLPWHMRMLFTKAFTLGLKNPEQRVIEDEWLTHLYALLGGIIPCPSCGAEIMYDDQKTKSLEKIPHVCWNPECRRNIYIEKNLAFRNGNLPVFHGAKLYPVLTEGYCGWEEADEPVGGISKLREDSEELFLMNCSEDSWTYKRDGKAAKAVKSGQAVCLKGKHYEIKMGQRSGVIE